jgi:pyruvate/2-oxoglutarate/acetoin dehydrogenase E1 component
VTVPFTLRMPIGRRNGYGATHSQSLEGMFLDVPGLRIMCPATVPDAVGMLRGAIRSDAPVLFLEPKLLYPKRGRMPAPDHVVQLGEARIDRVGGDLTLITYGLCLELCRAAADVLEARGHGIEIVDLRSLAPIDRATCVASIKKTGRALCVQEASSTGGVADVVIGTVLPEVFGYLRAPILKVGAEHCPIPSSPDLEAAIMPSARDVVRAALPLLTEY